uniref:Uncharacterized protein n=1 Tax=Encephalitozoon cuniculi TaxID=6035 RepID=M1K7P2_ENCCN|nr:hypothetical protein ECU08_1010 [Encephalitozoon cuniculi]
MEEEKDTKKKRVSFAPEPQVMYIYPEEENRSNRTMDSGVISEDEISVELTVDHLRAGELQNGEDEREGNFLNAELNDLVSCSTSSRANERDGPTNEDVFGGRKDVQDVLQGSSAHAESPPGCTDGEPVGVEAGSAKDGDGCEGLLTLKPSKAENAKEEFEDTLISNETINVEEIINTQDLRKMIPQARREAVNVSEMLVSKGIRFLDSLVVSNTRRDTMSKSRNEVHPRQEKFYANFVEPRTRFFLDFSSELEDRISQQEKVNADLEREFVVSGTVLEKADASSQLKALKTECRMRAKIEWYELRKEKEVEFNREVTDRKNKLALEYNLLAGGLKEVSEKVEDMKSRNEKMEEQIRRIKSRVGADGEGKHQKISELRTLMSEQEEMIESIGKELKGLSEEKMKRQVERRVLCEAMEKTEAEIKELEKALKIQSVTEAQLKEVRQEFRTLCAVFNMELVRADGSEVRFKLLGYDIRIGLDAGLTIRSVDATALCDRKGMGVLHHYFAKHFGGAGLRLSRGVKDAVFVAALASGLYKELEIVKKSHGVECSLSGDEVTVEILLLDVLRCSKREVTIKIRNGFECLVVLEGRSRLYDLRSDVGVVSRSVEEALVNSE